MTSGQIFVATIFNGGNMGRNGSMINDQWNSSKRNLNESMTNDKNRLRELRAERIAHQLVEKFGAPNSYKFFLKCAYRMSENDIWTAYENAHRGRINSPIRYFVTICSRRPEMLA